MWRQQIRVPGILQRIAFAYGTVGLVVLLVPTATTAADPAAGRLGRHLTTFREQGWRWLAVLLIWTIYFVIMRGVTVPNWRYRATHAGGLVGPELEVTCGVRGDLSPKCSALRWLDQQVLGFNHMCAFAHLSRAGLGGWVSALGNVRYPPPFTRHKHTLAPLPPPRFHNGKFRELPACSACSPDACPKPLQCPPGTVPAECPGPVFVANCSMVPGGCAEEWCYGRLDPEGILSSIAVVVTTFIGFHFGMVLQRFDRHTDRLGHWAMCSATLLVLGVVLSAAWPFNKQQWSPSYLLLTAGTCGATLTLCYTVLDTPSARANPYSSGCSAGYWLRRAAAALFRCV